MIFGTVYWKNLDPEAMSRGWAPGDKLGDMGDDLVTADDIESAPDIAFELHNRDDRRTGQMCPSMSVGDVVEVFPSNGNYRCGESRYFACASVGWKPIDPVTFRDQPFDHDRKAWLYAIGQEVDPRPAEHAARKAEIRARWAARRAAGL